VTGQRRDEIGPALTFLVQALGGIRVERFLFQHPDRNVVKAGSYPSRMMRNRLTRR
jgi:hypothetical protein